MVDRFHGIKSDWDENHAKRVLQHDEGHARAWYAIFGLMFRWVFLKLMFDRGKRSNDRAPRGKPRSSSSVSKPAFQHC
jgi:hypothetical protein